MRQIVPVPTPEIRPGSFAYVRSLTSAEHGDAQMKWANWRRNQNLPDNDYRQYDAFYSCFTICDPDGKTIFSPNDVEQLAQWPAKVLGRIVAVAGRLNGNSQQEIEDLAKNLEAAPSGCSGTG